jgi:hypothetical protein
MYQKDYILRLIEMAAKALAALLGLIKGGKLDEASEELDNLYFNFLKEDAAFFREIPMEKLTGKLLEEHNYTNGHLEILAELFNAEAELCIARDDKTAAKEYFRKSLILMEFTDKANRVYSQERINRMEKIRKRLI